MKMLAHVTTVLLSICSLAYCAEPPAAKPLEVPRTDQFEIAAPDGYAYHILVAMPKEAAPESGYAVVYVLDANSSFLTWVDAVRFQKGLTPAIVVGIAHRGGKLDLPRRYWDYTPKTPDEHIIQRSNSSEGNATSEGTGGEEAFYSFIQETLKPEIGKRFKVDSSKQALFGHSLAGRFVLHVLAKHPEAFQGYLASSPSIWWNNASLLDEFSPDAGKASAGRRVLITVGEFEQKTAPTAAPDRVEFFAKAKMVDNARLLAERLKGFEGIDVAFVEYAGENHGSVQGMAVNRAVRFFLPAGK